MFRCGLLYRSAAGDRFLMRGQFGCFERASKNPPSSSPTPPPPPARSFVRSFVPKPAYFFFFNFFFFFIFPGLLLLRGRARVRLQPGVRQLHQVQPPGFPDREAGIEHQRPAGDNDEDRFGPCFARRPERFSSR